MWGRRHATSLLAVALAAGVVAGCGSSGNDNEGGGGGGGGGAKSTAIPQAQLDQKVADQIPADVKSKGLTVAADASYPPNEFIGPDGKTVIGMDADLAKSLGQVMGVKMRVVNANFDSIIPGLASHKYDVGMSSFTDTKEREKTVDFVTYFSAGTSFYVKASGGPTINTLADLCGHKVAAEKGTTQADDANKQAKQCKSQGKKPVQVQVFPDQNGVNLALSSGRADVAMADSPVAAYQIKKTGGQFKVTGKTYGTAPYGIAVPKDSKLAQPILDALKDLMKGGQYKAILDKWGIQAGAISNPVKNGATS